MLLLVCGLVHVTVSGAVGGGTQHAGARDPHRAHGFDQQDDITCMMQTKSGLVKQRGLEATSAPRARISSNASAPRLPVVYAQTKAEPTGQRGPVQQRGLEAASAPRARISSNASAPHLPVVYAQTKAEPTGQRGPGARSAPYARNSSTAFALRSLASHARPAFQRPQWRRRQRASLELRTGVLGVAFDPNVLDTTQPTTMVFLLTMASCFEVHAKDLEFMRALTLGEVLVYLAGPGLCQVGFETCASIAFFSDIDAAGVNSAIMTSDPIVVGIFFFFYQGETFTLGQLMGFVLTVAGATTIGVSSTTGEDGGQGLVSVLYCSVSMLCLAGVCICNRLGAACGVSTVVQCAFRLMVMGLGGLCIGFAESTMGYPIFSWEVAAWSFIGAAFDALGIYAATRSFSYPKVITAVNVAVMSACSVLNMLLCLVLLGLRQPSVKYFGMAMTVSGILLLSLARLF